MKKIFKVIFVVLLVLLTVPVSNNISAAGSLTTSGNTTVKKGDTFEIAVNLSGVTISSASIETSVSGGIEVVKGEWVMNGTLMKDYSNNQGVAALSSEAAVNGRIFVLKVKATQVISSASVTFKVQLKKGSTDVATLTATHKVKVICSSHSFGDWSIKDATCTQNGYKKRTCSVCGTVETVNINPLGHVTGEMETVKEPTCLEEGLMSGKCTRCGQETTQTIAALGHDWGSWVNTKASTCIEHGEDTRKCYVCGAQETREVELSGHVVGDDVVVIQEATLTEHGVVEGTCTVCGQKVRTESECISKDETTGVEIHCSEGVFAEGTEIVVQQLEVDSEELNAVSEILTDLGSDFVAFDISAIADGVKVQPNGTVEITVALPEGFSNNTAVVFVSDDGTVEIMNTKVKDGKITAQLTHFSTYALLDLTAKEVAPVDTTNNIYLYTTIAFACTTILFFVLFITKKTKRVA